MVEEFDLVLESEDRARLKL